MLYQHLHVDTNPYQFTKLYSNVVDMKDISTEVYQNKVEPEPEAEPEPEPEPVTRYNSMIYFKNISNYTQYYDNTDFGETEFQEIYQHTQPF